MQKKFSFFKLFGILNMKDKKEKHERVKKTNRCTIFVFQIILHIIYER